MLPDASNPTRPIPEGGVDRVIAEVNRADPALPLTVYERSDPDSRRPLTTWVGLRGDLVQVREGEKPFDALRRVLAESAPADRVVALISYPDRPDGPGTASFMRLTQYLVLDHDAGSMQLAGSDLTRLPVIRSSDAPPGDLFAPDDGDSFAWRAALDEDAFVAAIDRFRSHAAEDDHAGVVLSVPIDSPVRADPVASYRVLRSINPSTAMFLFRANGLEVWGSTSLSLVEVVGKAIIAETDGATREFPPESPEVPWEPTAKEISEYDVVARALEEDVATVARPGTLRFTRSREERRFFRLGHLFARVEAELGHDTDAIAAVEALSPHGAAVGHPRRRALALIAELESVPRGPYAGSIGVYSPSGDADVAAVIRSGWTTAGGTATRAGAKIVPGSDPRAEYRESVLKTRAIRESARRGADG